MFNNHDSSDLTWRPRLGYYANPSRNGKLFVDTGKDGKPDPSLPVKATSYDWWVFFLKIDGRYVFNDHYYSTQTRAHQRGVREILKRCGIAYVEVNTKASLSRPEEVLAELQTRLLQAEEHLAYLYTKRGAGNGWGTIEKRREDAKEAIIDADKQLDTFIEAFQISRAGVNASEAQVKVNIAAAKERKRKEAKEQREGRKEEEKQKKEMLASSWNNPSFTLPHVVERPEFNIEPTGDEELDKVLTAFLTTDKTRERIGKYWFIDGTDLVYRCVSKGRRSTGKLMLCENVVARKIIEDGRMIVVGNSTTLELIGRKVCYGREYLNYSETKIQRQLSRYVTMIPFGEFAKRRDRWTGELVACEVSITFATLTIYKLTGKVPRPSVTEIEKAA